jgi:hypothetical protein
MSGGQARGRRPACGDSDIGRPPEDDVDRIRADMLSPEFLDAETFPEIRFSSDRIERRGASGSSRTAR